MHFFNFKFFRKDAKNGANTRTYFLGFFFVFAIFVFFQENLKNKVKN
jgi:hypothetical protein